MLILCTYYFCKLTNIQNGCITWHMFFEISQCFYLLSLYFYILYVFLYTFQRKAPFSKNQNGTKWLYNIFIYNFDL